MKAYKGFNKDMTCRGFQYEEGKEYTENSATLCESGFHACLDPIDCFGYYEPGKSIYREVEMDDVSEKRDGDSAVCARRIAEVMQMDEIKSCPFCGGNGKVSFKDYKFIGKNYCGQKKVIYRVQVICNRCRSRGKPIITDALTNPNPYISEWGNCGNGKSETGKHQSDMFRSYVNDAIAAWNTRYSGGVDE